MRQTSVSPGFFASRRNYDVAQGVDAAGRRRSGVLEQSWRLGGASGAEIAALEAFGRPVAGRRARNDARGLRACPSRRRMPQCIFRGTDPHVGPLTKYAWTESYADT